MPSDRLSPAAVGCRVASTREVGPRCANTRPRGAGLHNRGARGRLFANSAPRQEEAHMTVEQMKAAS